MSNTYAVSNKVHARLDVPNGYDAEVEWMDYDYFETKEEAIKFARHHFGADKNGCICLVSEFEDEETENE